jgi:hypothetical protein
MARSTPSRPPETANHDDGESRDDVPEEHDPEIDEVVASERAGNPDDALPLSSMLTAMGASYRADPVKAVRSSDFIKYLHRYIGTQLDARLTKFAKKRRIKVVYSDEQEVTMKGSRTKIVKTREAHILSSTKPKNVDVAVVDPENGPLVIIGVRSQMSSVSKNVLTYYEGIIGECISLQDRFPMSTHAYIYLHPLTSIKEGKEQENIDHERYARFYADASGRSGPTYKTIRGIFDQFAYMVVDFEASPPTLHDDIVRRSVPGQDMSIETFVDRIVATFNSRMLFWEIFE